MKRLRNQAPQNAECFVVGEELSSHLHGHLLCDSSCGFALVCGVILFEEYIIGVALLTEMPHHLLIFCWEYVVKHKVTGQAVLLFYGGLHSLYRTTAVADSIRQ